MNLPDIDKKQLSRLEEKSYRKLGYQHKGIPPRLAKKRSVIEKIKRRQASKRSEDGENTTYDKQEGQERFPFIQEDLRYYRIKEDNKRDYNAVVLCIMDVSGSMDQTKNIWQEAFISFCINSYD